MDARLKNTERLTNIKLELNPCMSLSITSRSHPTKAATPAPIALPRKTVKAEILERSMIPIRTSIPAVTSLARNTCPTPMHISREFQT